MTSKLRSALHSRTVIGALGVALMIPIIGLASTSTASTVPSKAAASAITPVPEPTAQTFAECPVDANVGGPHGHVTHCIVGVAAQGAIDIGSLDTTFHGPGIVQGAFDADSPNWPAVPNWADALNGQSYSAPPQLLSMPVMAILGYPDITPPADSDVWVVTQQAGPMGFSISTPGQGGITPYTVIPLTFRLENPLLGSNCYIGTDSDPITLHLTTGISGALTGNLGSLVGGNNGHTIQTVDTEVVDGTFSTPGATGCGTGGVWDSAIDATGDLPSPSGANKAMLYGTFDLAYPTSWVKHQLGE
jgi:hypothetical protein